MAGKTLNGVFQRIRTLAGVHASRAHSDRELLERFLAAQDEGAFTFLVERHGPMILALCRRLLRDRHEADDACQATFLVLARKVRSVRKQESLASWLHGVAYRICLGLRRQHLRRLRREQAVGKPSASKPDDDPSWRDVRAVLDEELQRLPERCRAPLILCYLEGKTRDEAAQQLGATPGAVHGLLNRGRRLLRERLIKRGLTLSGVLFAGALGEAASGAALAPPLVVAAARGALALVRGETIGASLIAPHVLSLVSEASKAMFMTKLKIAVAVVAAAGILTGMVGGTLNPMSHAQETAVAQTKPAPAATSQKTESDEEFIRRISKDLRGVEPTSTEVHFFVSSKDDKRRQKLIDLFIQERQAKERAQAAAKGVSVQLSYTRAMNEYYTTVYVRSAVARRLASLQGDLLKDLSAAAKDKKEVAAITQKYLDQLQEYVKAHPKHDDVPEAMQQIALIYRHQGKTVEADAWRDKLLKEHPQSPAAKAVQKTSSAAPQSLYQLNYDFGTIQGYPTQSYFPNLTTQPHPSIFDPYGNQSYFAQPTPRKEETEKQK